MHRVVHIFNIVIGKGSCSLCYLVNDPSAIMKKHRSRDTAIAWVQPGNIGRTGEEEASLDILGNACPRLADIQTARYFRICQPQRARYFRICQPQTATYTGICQPQRARYPGIRQPQTIRYSRIYQPQTARYPRIYRKEISLDPSSSQTKCAVQQGRVCWHGVLDCGLGPSLVARTVLKKLTTWMDSFEARSRVAADCTFLQAGWL